MKKIILLILTIQFSTLATISTEKENAIIKHLAKSYRRALWVDGYQDVESSSSLLNKEKLGQLVSNEVNASYEDSLSRDEISNLYRCLHKSTCHVHLISVSASYYGGYGVLQNFIMLDLNSGDYESIEHTAYAE